jgi:CheY-like chemotaxis protein
LSIVIQERSVRDPRPRRVLVVEDEWFIALAIAESLERAGAVVIGPCPSVDAAIEALKTGEKIDAAILDIKLPDGDVYDFARQLRSRKIPFGFSSGWAASCVPQDFREYPFWEKPCDFGVIAGWLTELRTPDHVLID